MVIFFLSLSLGTILPPGSPAEDGQGGAYLQANRGVNLSPGAAAAVAAALSQQNNNLTFVTDESPLKADPVSHGGGNGLCNFAPWSSLCGQLGYVNVCSMIKMDVFFLVLIDGL